MTALKLIAALRLHIDGMLKNNDHDNSDTDKGYEMAGAELLRLLATLEPLANEVLEEGDVRP